MLLWAISYTSDAQPLAWGSDAAHKAGVNGLSLACQHRWTLLLLNSVTEERRLWAVAAFTCTDLLVNSELVFNSGAPGAEQSSHSPPFPSPPLNSAAGKSGDKQQWWHSSPGPWSCMKALSSSAQALTATTAFMKLQSLGAEHHLCCLSPLPCCWIQWGKERGGKQTAVMLSPWVPKPHELWQLKGKGKESGDSCIHVHRIQHRAGYSA